MNWTDPKKFDHLYEESFDEESNRLEQRKMPASTWVKPERDYDDYDVKTGVITQEQLDRLMTKNEKVHKPAVNVEYFKLNWTWEIASNSDPERVNKIRHGSVHKREGTHFMLGTNSFTEFSEKLIAQDKAFAHEVYDQIKTEWMLTSSKIGDFEIGFWVARESKLTVPGCWIITVEDFRTQRRHNFCFANDELTHHELKQTKTSVIKL